jgi:hypothetical protein
MPQKKFQTTVSGWNIHRSFTGIPQLSLDAIPRLVRVSGAPDRYRPLLSPLFPQHFAQHFHSAKPLITKEHDAWACLARLAGIF